MKIICQREKISIRCYQKCGFKNVCVIPKRELKDGIRYDSFIMKIDSK